jgi:hypothetical protein
MQYLGTGLGLVARSLPLLGLRLGLSLVLSLVLTVYVALAAALGWGLWRLNELIGIIVFGVALIALIPVYSWLSRYVLYLAEAAHVAVMVELLEHGQLPVGQSQIAWGKAQVRARFRDTSALFVVHELVTGAVRAFGDSLSALTGWLPIEGLDWLLGLLRAVLRMATGYVDRAILSRAYLHPQESVWTVARDGLILYAMCWKSVLKQAALLAVLSLLTLPLFVVVLGIPAAALSAGLALVPRLVLGLVVLLLAIVLKAALADTVALAAMLALYHRETQGRVPNPEWEARLEGLSDRFRQLQQRAGGGVSAANSRLSRAWPVTGKEFS